MSNRDLQAHDAKSQARRCQILSVGMNSNGQQLNGSKKDVKKLQPNEPMPNIKQKQVENIHTIDDGATFIHYDDGDVDVGGANGSGQLGIGSSSSKITKATPLRFKVKQISKGIRAQHVFISTDEGDNDERLLVAGWNSYGQLGVDTPSDVQNVFITGPEIPIDIKDIACGCQHTIFLGCQGLMYACGSGAAIGLGHDIMNVPIPTLISTKVRMKQIVTGYAHCVALSQAGDAFAWGWNRYGQCGRRNTTNIYTPTEIEALKGQEMASVSCGVNHTMFVSSDGTMMATGYNRHGECGDGTTDHVYNPKQIAVGKDKEMVDNVRCGAYHNVAVTVQKQVYIWGWNKYSQCAILNTTKDKILTPTQYVLPKKWSANEVQVIPGHFETRIVKFGELASQSEHPKERKESEVVEHPNQRLCRSKEHPKESKEFEVVKHPKSWTSSPSVVVEHPKEPKESEMVERKESEVVDTPTSIGGKDTPPEKWNGEKVATWLCSVENGKYARYKDGFIENEVDGEDLAEMDKSVLARPQYHIKKPSHQRGVAQAIQNLLSKWNDPHDDDDEMVDDIADDDDSKTDTANSRNNPLIVCVGIAKYKAPLDDLDTAGDIRMYQALFEGVYNYKVIANDPSKPMNPNDLKKFLGIARGQHLYDFGSLQLNYDSLIVTFGGHGTYDSVICSDGTKFRHKSIRDVFKMDEFKDIPKIFLFDACRVDDYEGDEKQKGRALNAASSFSSTLMTSEGHKVYGAKICKYVTEEFKRMHHNQKFTPFGKVYRAACDKIRKETNNEQDLVLCEHDYHIDDVVFVPRDKARGTKGKRCNNDTRQASTIDFLATFLGNIKMECYYKQFKKRGLDKKEIGR
eukprot:789952_1